MRPLSLPVAAVLAVTAALAGAGPAHAGTYYQYSFHESGTEVQTTSGVGDDTGLCDPVETVTLTHHVALHATAREPGLTFEQVDALLDDDPDGVIVRATYPEAGTFVAEEGGHTYTGHFASWFGGGMAGPQFVFTGTFSVVGTSELGTRLHAHFVGHFVGGEDWSHVEFNHGSVEGCLPAV